MSKRNADEFTRLERTPKKKRWFEQCTKCAEAYDRAPDEYPPPEIFKGREEKYATHRKTCPHRVRDEETTPSRAQIAPVDWELGTVATFHRLLVEFQHSNKLPDTFINARPTNRLFEFLCQNITIHVPSQKFLGGDLLTVEATRCWAQDRAKLRAKVKSYGGNKDNDGRVNLLTDAWQNISRAHLNACQLSLAGQVHTFAVQALTARHDGLKIAEELETVIKDAMTKAWAIGAVVTDNAGQCGLARRILARRWPNIVFLFCFAHAINNLVKAVLKTAFKDVTTKAAQAVNFLIASSAKWLVHAKSAMWRKYREVLNFLSLCETRWNSVQACFASLLRVRAALELFWWEWNRDKEYPAALQVFGDHAFWAELQEAEEVVRPLSNASYMLQRDQNTVADVVACFGEIYDGFASNATYGDQLVAVLEDRWRNCEQPLLMLGFFLHPRYAAEARQLPSTSLSALSNIADVAEYYYRRLFQTEELGRLRPHLLAWFRGSFTTTDAALYSTTPLDYWADLGVEKPKSVLPVLASAILSIAVNTATCERLFSELALIHTATRNRLRPSKALDIHVVRKHLREQDESTQDQQVQLRIVDPTERPIKDVAEALEQPPQSQNQDGRQEPTNSSRDAEGVEPPDADVEDIPEIDDVFWEEFIAEIIDEDLDEEMGDGYSDDEEEDVVVEEVLIDIDSDDEDAVAPLNGKERIPVPKRPPFPARKQAFAQEKTLIGIRATKVTLEALFERRRQLRLKEKRRAVIAQDAATISA